MKLSNRQLVLGSLQPLLFCVGMYCVVLLLSVFVCSSLYHAIKGKKAETTQTSTASVSNVNNQNGLSALKQ